MSDRKKIPKKKLLKVIIKLIAPLFLILGIFVGHHIPGHHISAL
jgi:hypothetical protein